MNINNASEIFRLFKLLLFLVINDVVSILLRLDAYGLFEKIILLYIKCIALKYNLNKDLIDNRKFIKVEEN